MSKNPFQVYNPVCGDDFYGRQEILSDILDDEEFSHAWIIGTRRSGKTSILKQLQYLIYHNKRYSQKYIPIFWNMQGIENVEGLNERFVKELCSLQRSHKELFEQLECDVQQVEEMELPELFEHIEKSLSHTSRQFLLLCDEVETLISFSEEEEYIFDMLRHCALGRWSKMVIAATGALWNLREHQKDIFSLLDEFAPPKYALEQLTHKEALALIRKNGGEDATFRIPASWEDKICELTNQMPFYIQLFCMALYELKPDNFKRAIDLAFRSYDFDNVLQNDLKGLQVIEKLVLLQVVEKPGISLSELEIQVRKDMDICAIQDFIKNLLVLGYLRKTDSHQFYVQNRFLQLWYIQHLRTFVEQAKPYVSPGNLKDLVHFFKTKGDLDRAIECAQQLLQQQPDFDNYYELGIMCRQHERSQEAIDYLHKALQIRPDDARTFLNLALAYRMDEEHEKYKTCFLKAFQLDPEMAFKAFEHQRQRAEQAQKARIEAEKKQKEAENRRKEEELKLETQKRMLSFLTHTLTNTMAGGQPTVEEILEIVQEDLGEHYHETEVYNLIHDLTGLYTIFAVVSNMLTTYKLYVNEPDTVMNHWKDDQGTGVSLKFLFALVFRQVIARIMFEERYKEQFNNLVAIQQTYSVKECKTAFFKHVLRTELTVHNEEQVFQWLETYFPAISFNLYPLDIQLNLKGVRFNILFSCFSEILYNALKYTDRQQPIQVVWQYRNKDLLFLCQNTFDKASASPTESQRGFAFIQELTSMIEGMRFSYEAKDSLFTVQLQLQETLLN